MPTGEELQQLRDQLSDEARAALDKIAEKNPMLENMKVEIAQVQKIVDALTAASDNPVNSLAKYEKIMGLFTTAAVGVASLGTGISGYGNLFCKPG